MTNVDSRRQLAALLDTMHSTNDNSIIMSEFRTDENPLNESQFPTHDLDQRDS